MILADVWSETLSKSEIAELYIQKNFFEEKLCTINLGSETELYLMLPESIRYDVQAFNNEGFEKERQKSLDNYKLVSFWWPL